MNKITRKKWTLEEEQFLKENSELLSYQELANKLGRTKDSVSKRVRSLNLKIKNPVNNYTYNVDYFEKVDTPEKAYWLGFIAADGCVLESGRLKIQLQYSDKEHLEKFNLAMDSNKEIKTPSMKLNNKEYPTSLIVFDSMKLVKDLKNLGVKPKKTYDMQLPNIKDELMRHYIRGLFDGDGTFYIGHRKDRDKKVFSIEFIGYNNDFLIELQSYLSKNSINMNWYLKRESTAKLSTSSKQECSKIVDYLYGEFTDDLTCLERKKNKAFEIKEMCLA